MYIACRKAVLFSIVKAVPNEYQSFCHCDNWQLKKIQIYNMFQYLVLNAIISSSREKRKQTISLTVTYLFIFVTWPVWTAPKVCWQLTTLYFISRDSFQKLLWFTLDSWCVTVDYGKELSCLFLSKSPQIKLLFSACISYYDFSFVIC